MARSRQELRQLTVEQLGLPFISGTADSSGGSTTTIKDTPDLSQLRDDALLGSWVFISDGTPSFRNLQITGSVQATGVATFIPALSAAPNSRAYEILPFSAVAVHQAIESALTQLFDMGLLVREFITRSTVVGSPIYNSGFELWTDTSAVDGWTGAGAGVVQTRERNNARIGGSEAAVGLKSASGSEGRLELNTPWKRFLWDKKGSTLQFYCWVQSSASSQARIGISNGSSLTYSDYHSGDGDWNLLNVEYTSSSSDTDLIPSLVVADADTVSYFMDCWIEGGGEVFEYPWPIAIAPDGPSIVHFADQNPDRDNSLGILRQLGPYRAIVDWGFMKSHDLSFPSSTSTQIGILQLPRNVAPGSRLRMQCTGPFTLPDSETEDMEVTLPESLMVAKMAAKILLERRMLSVPQSTRRLYQELMGQLVGDVVALSSGHGQSSDVVSFGPAVS
jgi:hypothetical protein